MADESKVCAPGGGPQQVTNVFTESSYMSLPADAVWARVRELDFATILPELVDSSYVIKASPTEPGCVRETTWRGGDVWKTSLTSLSDDALTVAWELVGCKPAAPFRARRDRVAVRRVTSDTAGSAVNHCLVEWEIRFSPDVEAETVAEARSVATTMFNNLRRAVLGMPGRPYVVPKLSADDIAVYYGAEEAKFSVVPGVTHPYTPGSLQPREYTPEKAAKTALRMKAVSEQGDEFKEGGYDKLYVPAVPAVDPIENFDYSKVAELPEVLQKPLLKTADGSIKGLRSGGRSAIVFVGKQGYRLKGCGNYCDGEYDGEDLRYPYPGLPVKPAIKFDWNTFSEVEGAVGVRGCAFDHTAKRELMMAGLLNDALTPFNFTCGLIPAAVWTYNIPEAPFPKVDKCCAVSRTFGERRLAQHLLTGLELLLADITPAELPDDRVAAMLAAFGEERGKPYSEKVFDPLSGTMTGTTEHPVKPTFMSSAPFVDFSDTRIPEVSPGSLPAEAAAIKEVHDFTAAWDHAVATYTAACKQVLAEREDMDDDDAEAATPGGAGAGAGATAGAGTSDAAASPSFGAQCAVLFHLYWRIGRETGSMQRAMQDAGLSWGYFLDHVPEPHNNAHPGNFVVLPPSADGMGPLLAPVDLDLAFTRGTYFDNSSSPPGARADSEFISALKHEHDALLDNLSGSTASTGLADMAGGKGLSRSQTILRWALRDTLATAFENAFNKLPDQHVTTAALDKATHALAKLGLIAAAARHS